MCIRKGFLFGQAEHPGRQPVIPVEDPQRKMHDIRLMFLRSFPEIFQKTGQKDIIGIQKQQIFAGSGADTGEADRKQPLVLIVRDDPDAGIPGGVFSQNAGRTIGGGVIYRHNLKILQRLGQNAVQTGRQIFFGIVNRNDDRNFRFC